VDVVALGPEWLDPEHLARTFGLIGILAVVFAECGLLIGFFMPGDSLLFTAGLLAASTTWFDYPVWLLCLYITLAAIAGNLVGYWIGAKVGPRLFSRENSRFFKQQYVDQTKAFFDKYGARAIILARFVPIVRTFITAMAGVSRMDFRRYALYSTIGGILWGTGVTVLGYLLGNVPFVRENIEFILIGIVGLSVLPIAYEVLRSRRESAREAG
jgi:membrane-associated protein